MIARKDLVNILKSLIPALDSSNPAKGSDFFIFDGKWLKTGNQTLSISHPLPSDSGIKGAVKAKELYKVLSKMSDDNVEISATDDNMVRIKDSVTDLQLVISTEEIKNVVSNKSLFKLEWEKIPDKMIESIGKCLFSASPDPNTGVWNAIYVGGNDILSTDNNRISWATIKGECTEFLLPVNSAAEVVKTEPDEYAVGETWVHFKNTKTGIIQSATLVLGDYPKDDLTKLFTRKKFETYYFPENIMSTIARVSTISFADGHISLTAKGGFLYCKGEREFGNIKDKLKITKGSFPEGREIRIHPTFFSQILPKVKQFNISGNVCIFETDKGRFKHLIALFGKD